MAASIWESSTLDGDYLPKPWTIRLKRIEKKRSTCPGWTRLVPKSSNVFSRSTHEFLRRREGTRLFAQGIPAHQLGLLLGVESRRRELIFLRSLSKARIVRGQFGLPFVICLVPSQCPKPRFVPRRGVSLIPALFDPLLAVATVRLSISFQNPKGIEPSHPPPLGPLQPAARRSASRATTNCSNGPRPNLREVWAVPSGLGERNELRSHLESFSGRSESTLRLRKWMPPPASGCCGRTMRKLSPASSAGLPLSH